MNVPESELKIHKFLMETDNWYNHCWWSGYENQCVKIRGREMVRRVKKFMTRLFRDIDAAD